MNATTNSKKYSRKEFLALLSSAMQVQNFRFMRQACTHWLSVFPGDLNVQLKSAEAKINLGQREEGMAMVETLLSIDPEFIDAYRLKMDTADAQSSAKQDCRNSLFALGNFQMEDFQPSRWAQLLFEVRNSHTRSDEVEAKLIDAAHDESNLLVSVHHLMLIYEKKNYVAAQHIAEVLEQKWPQCLQIQLIKADCLINQYQRSEGMNILQKSMGMDPAGIVPSRLWGKDHPNLRLWPEILEVDMDLPVPADVSAKAWGNKLGGGGEDSIEHGHGSDYMEFPSQEVKDTEDFSSQNRIDLPPDMEEECTKESVSHQKTCSQAGQSMDGMEKLSLRLQKHELGDARYPVCVLLSCHKNMVLKYGEKTTIVIENELDKLCKLIAKKKGWAATILLPDLESSAVSNGINPILETTPWNVKLALSDLDQSLAKKGEMIGAVLIIGGDEVVPFHRLPNPTDDSDNEVLSDNPYATLDANYFVPEWQVGRFPGSSDSDSGLILKQIRQSIQYHASETSKVTWLGLVQNWFRNNFIGDGVATISQRKGRSYGYTAAVWRRSSLAAFRPVGDGRDLFISPSSSMSSSDKTKLVSASLSYFNLHGLSDAPHWFGQKEASDRKSKEEFPIALSPGDVDQGDQVPQLVFSEACYGAHIIAKHEGDSIALKFVDRGTLGFIGSTCVSYGSISTPLIGGDLLGNLFWKNVKEGYSIGEALLRAKVDLVREMTRRQGFLDGEDQKTVVSFVLYGDPLVSRQLYKGKSKGLVRTRQIRIVKTVCDRDKSDALEKQNYSKTILQAKSYVEANLPGFSNCDVHVNLQKASCDGTGHHCPNAALGKTVQAQKTSNHTVVVFSKSLPVANFRMHQFARLTLDKSGKLVKMAVSR